jgi:hypothetical protein
VSDLDELSELLRQWDQAALLEAEREGGRLVPEAQERGSILRPGATETDIVAAERRLGVRFPPWYRAFLALSNGADAGEGGPNMLLDLGYDQDFTPAGLLAAQEVVRLEVGDTGLWRIFKDGRGWGPGEMPEQEPLRDGWPVMVVDTTPIRDALLISHVEQNATLMLVPVAGDWQVWGHEYMGPRAFASLVSWLRWQLAVLEPKTPD